MKPGYLIGGVLKNFPVSARMGDSDFFVVEADEYDSAFFDKRSKFVHYRPRTLILNNLEFDHADIFADLAAIQRQFHHLIRTVPAEGQILKPAQDEAIDQVLAQGCWTPTLNFAVQHVNPNAEDGRASAHSASPWSARMLNADGSHCEIIRAGSAGVEESVSFQWSLSGRHSASNALAAVAAAHHVGVPVSAACDALSRFSSVKRRMELLGEVAGIYVYDDFAHHPTAIDTTLEGIRQRLASDPACRLIAVIEPRSATMKMGIHQSSLGHACRHADLCIWLTGAGTGAGKGKELDIDAVIEASPVPALGFAMVDDIVNYLATHSRAGDHVVIMSNGGFGGIHRKLLEALQRIHDTGR